MGSNGRNWVVESFGWSSISEQMLGVYQWVLDGTHRGSKPQCVRWD